MSYVVAATYTVTPGEEESVLSNLEAMISPTRAEPGCQVYIPHRSQEDPSVFFLYEQYSDEDGFRAHVASDHFERHIKNEVWPRLAERRRVIATPLAD
jgi:quinol monooxygenase YgiN